MTKNTLSSSSDLFTVFLTQSSMARNCCSTGNPSLLELKQPTGQARTTSSGRCGTFDETLWEQHVARNTTTAARLQKNPDAYYCAESKRGATQTCWLLSSGRTGVTSQRLTLQHYFCCAAIFDVMFCQRTPQSVCWLRSGQKLDVRSLYICGYLVVNSSWFPVT